MSKLKIGVIGAGGRGVIAAQAHHPGEGSRIVACCDIATSDYRELSARDMDAVFVCAPDFLHEEMAVAALQSGLSVYQEKPMAITTQGCDGILEVARLANARIFVGHNMRYMAFF